jgi:hypothetical protein
MALKPTLVASVLPKRPTRTGISSQRGLIFSCAACSEPPPSDRVRFSPRRALCEQILLIVTLAPKASHERSYPRTDVTHESPRPGKDILFAARSSKKEAAVQAIFLQAIGDGIIPGALWW